MKFYHWTYKNYLPSIMEHGLKPGFNVDTKGVYVHLSNNKEDWEWKGDICIEVDLERKNIITRLHRPVFIRDGPYTEYLFEGTIPPNKIKIIEGN